MGYQCHDPAGHHIPNATMNDLVKSVRATDAREEGWTKVVLKPGMAADKRTSGSRVEDDLKPGAKRGKQAAHPPCT